MDALVCVCSSNVVKVWAWCSGHCMILEHERTYRLGMDAMVGYAHGKDSSSILIGLYP